MTMRSWRRWTVRSLRALTLAAAAAGFVGAAAAQDADAKTSANLRPTYTKNTNFKLPIQMDERMRASLKEVQLYVKNGSGDWARQEVVGPSTPHFEYRVPGDGEYWFSLVTVDKIGKATPADVANEPPALRIVVDTRPPVVDVQPGMGPDGSYLIKCTVVDANSNPAGLKVVVKTDAGERALAPVQPGIYKISTSELDFPIIATATDLAGNVATREAIGRELFASVVPPSAPPAGTAPFGSGPIVPTAGSKAAPPPSIPPILPPAMNPAALPPPIPSGTIGSGTIGSGTVANYQPQPAALPPAFGSRPARTAGNRQLINTTQAQIDYRIETVGPSGVGKVEVYMTPDNGQRWIRLGEDADRRSPADVEFPGEGVFGIRFVITNGNGFGGRAPQPGDQPAISIEVDTTPPFVQLRPVELNPQTGTLDIRWTATDKNLGDEPVSIFCRTTSDGTWHPIARNVKNDGAYRWSFPRDLGQQFFIKVEVADLAGNVARVETPNPIMLDTTVPTVDVVGVSARPNGPR